MSQKQFNKVLILSASAGAGHIRAADALVKGFNQLGIAKEIFHLDILQYTNKAFRNLYSKAYIDMANNAPDVLGWIYDVMDKPWKNEQRMKAFDRLNTGLFMKVLKRHQPDLVVNTHFLPADIIAYLRKKEKLACKQAMVITDFDVHAMWLNKGVDYYFTACEEARQYMIALGIQPSIISTTGIPIDSVFSDNTEKQQTRIALGLHPTTPTALISAGGFGVGNMEHMLNSLITATNKVQILAMCGKNKELFHKISTFSKANNNATVTIHAVGFTTEMHTYMSASDIMIGKPGGLTVSESLAKGLAMIIVNPIPGQEERNSDYLLESGIALKCNNLPTLAYKLDSLLGNPNRLQQMQSNALKHATPKAAQTIASLCSTML